MIARTLGSDLLLFDYPRDRFFVFENTKRIAAEVVADPAAFGWKPSSNGRASSAFVSWIVSPTARCSSRCRYCFAAHYDLGDLPLGARELQRLGAAARAAGLLRCDLSGGEPFLRKDLEAIVDALLESVGVILTTSAIGMSAARFASVCKRLPVIQISLDGHTDAMNAPRGHAVKPVRAAIEDAIAMGVNVRVLTVAHAFNAGQLPELGVELQRWGVWEWKVLRVVPAGGAAGWEGLLDDARSAEVARSLADAPLPVQLVGFGPAEPRTCVVLEDDLHLHIDRAGAEEDLGPVDLASPFDKLQPLLDDQRNHLRYYLFHHAAGGVLARPRGEE